jgi:hypothetical protein
MKPDRKQMMDERKSLMREFRQVRQTMVKFPAKGKREKNDVSPRGVLEEIRMRLQNHKDDGPTAATVIVTVDARENNFRGNTVKIEAKQ